MATVNYLSNRTNKTIRREGDVIVDQQLAHFRRIVLLRPNGKKLMVDIQSRGTVRQRRDDESKWTKTGRMVDAAIEVTDTCHDCGEALGTLHYTGVALKEHTHDDGYWRKGRGDWSWTCNRCGLEQSFQEGVEEPDWPEPDTRSRAAYENAVREYMEWANTEYFDGEIDVGRVNLKIGDLRSYLGRANGWKMTLSPKFAGESDYYDWKRLLQTVRHEMIHVWQGQNNGGASHNTDFHQWIVPARCTR